MSNENPISDATQEKLEQFILAFVDPNGEIVLGITPDHELEFSDTVTPEEMADRIGIMHRGRLIALGSREALRTQSGRDGALEETFLALTAEEANLAAVAKKPGMGDGR